jgi:hypothetical protein
VVGEGDREASQTRDYCVAKYATDRAARPDPSASLGTGSSQHKKRVAQDDSQLSCWPSAFLIDAPCSGTIDYPKRLSPRPA